MGKLHCHTGVHTLLVDDGGCPCLFLEWDNIVGKLVLLRIISHIQQAEADLSQTCRRCTECAACHNLVNQFVGHHLSCLIVESKRAEEVFLYGKVFHEL